MKLSDATKEVEEWLDLVCSEYEISQVVRLGGGEYRFYIHEDAPVRVDEYYFTVYPNGQLYNMNGTDCVTVCKGAYDDQPEMIQWLNNFEAKWYKAV